VLRELVEFQKRTFDLAQEAWPDDKPSRELADALSARLFEEGGELSRAVRRYGRKRFGHPGEGEGTAQEVADEIGDVLFLLARIANLCKIPLDYAAQKVIDKITDRLARRARGCE